MALVDEAVGQVLQTRGADGWLGPDEWPDVEMVEDRVAPHVAGLLSASIWARIPLLQALVQYAEWRGRSACDAFSAVWDFVLALGRRLDAGRCMLVAWSSARWPDLISTLNWLSTHVHGPREDIVCRNVEADPLLRRLKSIAWIVRIQGFDWARWFRPKTLPSAAVPRANFSLYSHGVNNAVALKWGAVWSAVFGDPDVAGESGRAWKLLRARHGVVSGAFAADEHLGGTAPHRGTELCVVVEALRSLADAYAASPSEPELADAIERLAYNALPAAVSDDHWSHQYLTQSNAAFAGIERSVALASESTGEVAISEVFGNVGADATAYGLSPNFPCCTVNFAQGWPMLLTRAAWLWDGGQNGVSTLTPALLSVAFVPSRIAKLPHLGGEVELETSYPFAPGSKLRYALRGLRGQLDLLVRVPDWADLTQSEVVGPGGSRWQISAFVSAKTIGTSAATANSIGLEDATRGRPAVLCLKVRQSDSLWEVRFAASWRLTHRAPWGGSFSLGPLVFVLPLRHTHVRLEADDGPYGPRPAAPSEVKDEELFVMEKQHGEVDGWAVALVANASNYAGLLSSIELVYMPGQLAEPAAIVSHDPFTSDGDMPAAFSSSACPVAARVLGVPWPAWRDSALNPLAGAVYPSLTLPKQPSPSPILLDERGALSPSLNFDNAREILLRPFGCTRLRMAVAPIIAVGEFNMVEEV
eukprot:TRINITY_DN55377_c0_g1_i1.p1 TRINITY_DN55377_c0_g1~~TRINITY_DN55377_c0_g1_i1.p1  ORF type:complete len:797 (-),score=91.48 TRINITY_DN55377_c0_g1_i1:158-2260(-)